eukprot:2897051-Pyramimonas_sp.AAC.1
MDVEAGPGECGLLHVVGCRSLTVSGPSMSRNRNWSAWFVNFGCAYCVTVKRFAPSTGVPARFPEAKRDSGVEGLCWVAELAQDCALGQLDRSARRGCEKHPSSVGVLEP